MTSASHTAISAELVRRRETCRLCDGSDLVRALSLAPTPPANAFVGPDELDREQPTFPLDVWFCSSCGHLQLLDVVDPAVLFRNYVYVSGTSPSFVAHFERYAEEVQRRFPLQPGDLVVDIGSNDGTLLGFFARAGYRVLGIDPAHDIARQATEAGIETLPAFFTPALARELREQRGPARVITANNVFAHIDDLSAAATGVHQLLAPDGVFVFEVSYLLDVFEKTLFDTIYHEHLDYHTVGPLVPFFDRHGLRLFDAQRVDSHGGSLRAMVGHASGPHQPTEGLRSLIELEHATGLDNPSTFQEFGAHIDQLGRQLLALLEELKAGGKRVGGYGAPAKATTLMHHFAVGPDLVEFIADDSPLKQGLFTPGFHIPVLPSSAIYERRPDYLLILAWNFAQPITASHQRFAQEGGRFIVPLPQLEVI